jgi:hypothetical protein
MTIEGTINRTGILAGALEEHEHRENGRDRVARETLYESGATRFNGLRFTPYASPHQIRASESRGIETVLLCPYRNVERQEE